MNNYLKDAEHYTENKHIQKCSAREELETLQEREALNGQNSQIQSCIRFGLNQLRQNGIREKPLDLALLKLLER